MVYVNLAVDDLKRAGHVAYEYPISHLPVPSERHAQIEIAPDSEALRLQSELLDKQMAILRMKMSNTNPMTVTQ